MTIIKSLNDSINLIAVALVLIALLFVWVGSADIARELVIGAMALAGGKALNHAANQDQGQQSKTTQGES